MNINDKFEFNVALKTYPTEGNLVYEYNPFYNYKITEKTVKYEGKVMSLKDFCNLTGISELLLDESTDWTEFPLLKSVPEIYQPGLLVDFETNLLDFSLNNPVDIIPQYSYDNSVNLIINDGKNLPRIINSRFSATERNKYLVCNRKGDNDSNIYDLGENFDVDTSLYKKMKTIPGLKFLGVGFGGNLSIGNYHFYFRYVDEDGNESDFFAESGLVSIFMGSGTNSIHSGFRDENAHKLVKFMLSNADAGYSKVSIYYTKSTSDIFQNAVTKAYKISLTYRLSDSGNTILTISGFEHVKEVPMLEINAMYLIYGSAETQTTAQNMLFLGNVDRPKIPYEDLADCALRFLPILNTDEHYNVNLLGVNYSGSIANTYYDPYYIYNKVGYWDDEIYRFGIVFLLSDNTLTNVFNTRGAIITSSTTKDSYTNTDFIDSEGNRVYINYDEQYYNIIDGNTEGLTSLVENVKGTVLIQHSEFDSVIGINFEVDLDVIKYLKETLNIKGYFFVRQKRIPTTLCLAYTIGIDKESNTPVLPIAEGAFIAEGFLTERKTRRTETGHFGIPIEEVTGGLLKHTSTERMYNLEALLVRIQGAICPEYDVNSPYLNSLFAASELTCRECKNSNYLKLSDIHYYPNFNFEKTDNYLNIKVIGVEDNVKLVGIDDYMFSARAGEAEEAFRYEYIGKKNVSEDATNLIRGSFGPYLGIVGYEEAGHLIDIKIPGYNKSLMKDYFAIRYEDKTAFYSISDRYSLEDIENNMVKSENYYRLKKPLYRGDCYICLVTHRMNRNFQDPSSPLNDQIVDANCWIDNFEVTDGVVKKEKFDKINLGDVNAVRLGMYVTLVVRSTMNLNIRAIDESIVDETALFGHPRGFYPYLPMTTKGAYKIPEALCYNKGFEKSLSEKYNYEIADVPWIKNEFSNRIAYSKVLIKDAFLNGWRTFIGTHYRDYPKTYGSITKLIEYYSNILCIFEHGVAIIPVNERALAGEGSGGNVYINTSNVLPENPKVISDIFGSLWKESVIKTPKGVYGVDTIGKKIWRLVGDTFECISDFYILEFLNLNISLTERELTPIIGIRNVKTHYNAFKGDVMFTFYDNLYGFEERVWNICFNENTNRWVTFYSWVPSYSENIYNLYFSFDRNTSKWISKLGVSKSGNKFADGVVLSENIIPNEALSGTKIGDLDLANRTLPSGDGIEIIKTFELAKDNFGNWKKFEIRDNALYLKTDAVNLCSELFVRGTKSNSVYTLIITDPKNQFDNWKLNCVLNSNYVICKDDRGRRINLDNKLNQESLVTLLNIKCNVKVKYIGVETSRGEIYASGVTNGTIVDAGYYQSVVAVTPEYNMQFLTTDFWKHGQAGIIDISDKIYPTYWYGKQHPFEYEFIVADKPLYHKIFDNLQIISNKAAPESFHYEIVGECYDFAEDKKNMYIRQEATKEFYQNNGFDVLYDHDYVNLEAKHRPIKDKNGNIIKGIYDKSTIFPLYYSRRDSFNEIEDFYHLKDNVAGKDFSALSGAEIVRYENLDEYRIWNHNKAVNIEDKGRLRGNMLYKEDKWYVLINPLITALENEDEWVDLNGNPTLQMPIELNLSPIPNEVLVDENGNPKSNLEIPENFEVLRRGYTQWVNPKYGESKLKDKYIKIRVRYSGKDLAIITAINTLYSISYG